MTRRRAPFSSQRICQGTMFEWCSIAEMTISSPGPTRTRPKVWATRLIRSDDAEARALLVAENLPGDDVRVVLHRRDDDLVARPDAHAPEGLGDQVDQIG